MTGDCRIFFLFIYRSDHSHFNNPLLNQALPDLLGLLYHVDQQLENRLSLKPHLDAVDNDI
jgi:hypothetical protein